MTSTSQLESRPTEAQSGPPPTPPRATPGKVARAPAIIVTIIVAAIVGLSLWFLVQPQPLIIQGEADATRIDIAARVDGRVGKRPVSRGDNVAAGQLLFQIDNPELLTKMHEAEAGLAVAVAQLANIEAGTRAEVVAQRKAAVESASANVTLAQRTYDRVKELAAQGNAPIQRLDETTNALHVARTAAWTEAKSAYLAAVNGYTGRRARDRARKCRQRRRPRSTRSRPRSMNSRSRRRSPRRSIRSALKSANMSRPACRCCRSSISATSGSASICARISPRASRSATDSRCGRRRSATGSIAAEIKVIATKGEYAGWRATRATGDFDLRTFEVRAYPVAPAGSAAGHERLRGLAESDRR